MSGDFRKRKSLWNHKEENEVPAEFSEHTVWHGRGNHFSHRAKWSDLEANNAVDSNDCSRWSSRETLQDNNDHRDNSINRELNEISEALSAVGGDKKYIISPCFNGRRQQNHSRSPENSWSQSRRYQQNSRDRDRDRDSIRSRSPLCDHRSEYYGWSDGRSGSRVSFQLCRDFAGGKCRRGSQCRFLHQDNPNLGDGGLPERKRAGILIGRQESGEDLEYADNERYMDYSLDKVSNYDRSNRSASFDHDHKREPRRNANIPCKYFATGRCHRDDCKFSHDGLAGGSVFTRLRDNRYGNNLDDENKCWNGPKRDDVNGVSDVKITGCGNSDVGNINYNDRTTANKQTYERWEQNLDENKSWNGPKLGDATSVSDVERSSGWVESNVGNVSFAERTTVEMQTDERRGCSMDYRIWSTMENHSNVANVDTCEITGIANSFGTEVPLNPQGSHSQRLDETSLVTYEEIAEGPSTQQLANKVIHPAVSENSYVQQPDSKRGDDNMLTDDSYALNMVSFSGNTVHLVMPGQSLDQNDSSGYLPPSICETKQRNLIPLNPLEGHEFDPYGPGQQLLYINPQSKSKILHEESIKKQEMLEFKVPQVDSGAPRNVLISDQVAQTTNHEIFSNEQHLPQLHATLNPQDSTELLTSLSSSASVISPVALIEGQHNPTTILQEQCDPIGDSIEPSKYANSTKPYEQDKPKPLVLLLSSSTEGPTKHGSSNIPYEQEQATPLEHFLPSSTEETSKYGNNNRPYDELDKAKPLDHFLSASTAGPDSSKLRKIGDPEKECQEIHKPKQQNLIANSEPEQKCNIISEKSKSEQEIRSDNVDGECGVREGNFGEDEKEMRFFKVALVEYVKEILKPKWKEGQMSRDVYKTIVKKVVDKVTSTILEVHVPKTQEKIDQYLSCSKPKLTKLVQAYTERLLKS